MNRNVSVIIVNWNGERFLDQCLTALMNQTLKPHEIILLDNGSSDKSIEVVNRFPSVKLIALNENTGFARGNNLGIAASSRDSEWIALLNPDAFVDPHWLEQLLKAVENNPEYDVFASKLITSSDHKVMDGAGDVYHVSGMIWRSEKGLPVANSNDLESEIFSPCAAAALYRRSALLKLGGFDEDYFCYVEDVDLGFRLRLAGYRCLYVPRSVAYHYGSGTTGGQHSKFSTYHGHRNLVWTFVKDMPSVLFWLLLPIHILLNVLSTFWFILSGRGMVILEAKRDAIKGLPKMWRKRQQIQSERVASLGTIWKQLDKRMLITKNGKNSV